MAQPKSVVGLDVHATQTTPAFRPRRASFAQAPERPPRRALDYLEGLQAPTSRL